MEIQRGFKYTPQQFNSESCEIRLSHEELGLAAPTTPDEVRLVAQKLAMHAEGLIIVEKVKHGILQKEQIADALKPWVPNQ